MHLSRHTAEFFLLTTADNKSRFPMLRHGNELPSTSWQTINREFVGEARSIILLILADDQMGVRRRSQKCSSTHPGRRSTGSSSEKPGVFFYSSWQTINREFVGEARGVLLLIDLLLSIPATSVEAVRGFSTMKLVKTDFRRKLSNTALNSLLRILLLSPTEADFNPMPAIEHWYSAVDRRLGTTTRRTIATAVTATTTVLSLSDRLQDAAGR